MDRSRRPGAGPAQPLVGDALAPAAPRLRPRPANRAGSHISLVRSSRTRLTVASILGVVRSAEVQTLPLEFRTTGCGPGREPGGA